MKIDTEVVRLPKQFVDDIKKVQNELKCSFQTAFKIWNQKKAQTGADIFFFIAFMLFLAIGVLVLIYINSSVITHMENTAVLNESTATMNMLGKVQTLQYKLDYVILAVMIGFAIGFIILGYFINTHPIFIPIYIIVLIVGLIVSYVFQEVWNKISDSSTLLATKIAYLPITDHIFSYLPLYFAILGIIGLVVTYAKPQEIR